MAISQVLVKIDGETEGEETPEGSVRGCIPSKALLHAAKVAEEARDGWISVPRT